MGDLSLALRERTHRSPNVAPNKKGRVAAMGLFDDYFAAKYRNDARNERAHGRSGNLEDMLANQALQRSISEEAQRVLRGATTELTRQLGEVLREQAEVAAQAERDRRTYEERKAAFAELKSKFRAAVIEIAVTTIREAQMLVRQLSERANRGSIFVKWADLRSLSIILRRSGIEDVSLWRDVLDTQLLLERLIPGGQKFLESLLAEITEVINEGYLLVLQILDLRTNPGGILFKEDSKPNKTCMDEIVPAVEAALVNLQDCRARCERLRPRLQALAAQKLLSFPEEGSVVFATEFEANISLEEPGNAYFLELAQRFDIRFDPADSKSLLNQVVGLVAQEHTADALLTEMCAWVVRVYETLITELREQLHIVKEYTPRVGVAFELIGARECECRDVNKAFAGVDRDPLKYTPLGWVMSFLIMIGTSAACAYIGIKEGNGLMGTVGLLGGAFLIPSVPVVIVRYRRAARLAERAISDLEETLNKCALRVAALSAGLFSSDNGILLR